MEKLKPHASKGRARVGNQPLYTEEEKETRLFCPYPGCKRSFSLLAPLKVHHRADPGGKPSGHGTELLKCPRCKAELIPGKYHKCSSGATGQDTEQVRERERGREKERERA